MLNRHRFGEHLLFIGDNVSVARVVGVNVGREKIKLFTLMGVLGAFAAVLLTAENKNFFNTQGSGFLLTVMAAVFIGGTSIFGGKATIVGSYVGAYIIGMIEAGLVATGMQGFWVRAVVGLVFLAAVDLPPDHGRPSAAAPPAPPPPRRPIPAPPAPRPQEPPSSPRPAGATLTDPSRSARRRDREAADLVALDQARDQARGLGLLDEVVEESGRRPRWPWRCRPPAAPR